MPTSRHYRIDAQGKRVYLCTDPTLNQARNWRIALERLAASGQSTLHLDIETYGTQVALPTQDDIQDRASKLLVAILASAMLGLVGLAIGALVSL